MTDGPKQLNPDLDDDQKRVLFAKGTEMPFTGKFLHSNESGMYTCVNCGAELFHSNSKYDSTVPGLEGWPSFADVAKTGAVKLVNDDSYGMSRLEVVCTNCGVHLGHVFDDRSSSTGQHYCINSVCLGFKPAKK
jgi:peptide-methionine (R)-S-oxide reductase